MRIASAAVIISAKSITYQIDIPPQTAGKRYTNTAPSRKLWSNDTVKDCFTRCTGSNRAMPIAHSPISNAIAESLNQGEQISRHAINSQLIAAKIAHNLVIEQNHQKPHPDRTQERNFQQNLLLLKTETCRSFNPENSAIFTLCSFGNLSIYIANRTMAYTFPLTLYTNIGKKLLPFPGLKFLFCSVNPNTP